MTKNIRNTLIECLEKTENGESMKKEMVLAIINKAISGDIRAFETVAKFIGEFPNKREMTETDAEIKSNPFNIL